MCSSDLKPLVNREPTRLSHRTPVVNMLTVQRRSHGAAKHPAFRREPMISNRKVHFTSEKIYKAANPRRVGSLERDKPIMAGINTLKYRFVWEL